MRRMLNKIIALLIIIEFVGINILTDAVYANNLMMESTQIKNEGIVFQANINNSNNTIADYEEDNNLNINLALKDEGFLKDIVITLNGNNYQIAKTADEINKMLMGNNEITNVTKIVKSIEKNEIYLKEIDKGEELNISIPIKYIKSDLVTKENLECDSTINMKATYINGQNSEFQQNREIKQHLKWKANAQEEVSQKLVRYLKYDNRTMVSFEVTDKITENKFPIQSKEINIQVPTINNQKPETITVVGEGINKEVNNDILKVTKNYSANERGEYNWNSENSFTVTYIYNTQADTSRISTIANARATTILGDILEGHSLNNEFEVNAEVGSIVKFETETPKELSKGYLYTNLNREEGKIDTTFNIKHKINIGIAELTDKIILEEKNNTFNIDEENQTADINSYITTSRVGIIAEELINTLGAEGKIIVRDSNLNELGILDKENTELNFDANNLVFETSKPIKEGLINIYEKKAIKGENNMSVEDLLAIKSLTMKSNVTGLKDGITVTSEEITSDVLFTDPTSNASIDINTENLSTVKSNNDVVLSVVLNTTDVNDALYIDPTIRINFPEEITSITPKSAKIIYDDQLVIDQIRTEDRSLVFELKGIQNKYNTLNTTKGTLLQVVADIEVNSLAPSNRTKITADYTNKFTSEEKTVEKEINIVAPYGMITTNQIDIDNQTVYTMFEDKEMLKIKNDGNEKEMQITGQVINNTGVNTSEFNILGRIPSKGNKTISGTDLKSTIDTNLQSPIEVEGLDNYEVYYSTDINEKLDGKGWTTQATNDSKSYKIVCNQEVNNKQFIKFNYSIKVPGNLEHDQIIKENYAVCYVENSKDGATKRTAESKILGIDTGNPADIVIGVTAVDTNDGSDINNGDEVEEGKYVSYIIKATNIGTEEAKDVSLIAVIPDEMTLLIDDGAYGTTSSFRESSSKYLLQNIGSLYGGESVTYEFTVRVDEELNENLTTYFSAISDTLEDNSKVTSYSLKCKPGYFGINLSSDVISPIEVNQDINYVIAVNNANGDDKTNTKVKLKLPKGIEYSSIESKYIDNTEYDKDNDTVTINLNTLKGHSKENIAIKAINKNYNIENLSTQAEIICDGLEKEIKSNSVDFETETSKAVIKATQTVNSNYIGDSEVLELYTDIKNTGSTSKIVQFKNDIPKELGVYEYKVTENGVLLSSGASSNIDEQIKIPANSNVRVMVKAKPYPITGEDSKKIENIAELILTDGTNLNIESGEITIFPTSVQTINDINNNTIVNKENTYSIRGNVWLDERSDGNRDAYEDVFKDMTLKLFDANNNRAVINQNGEEITTVTNEFGEYEFNNLLPGNYYVIGLFNDLIYEISKFKADGIDETLNSDFISALLDDENVAATDVISLIDSNIDNIDLGLVEKEIFDLAISQTVNKISVASRDNYRTIAFDNETANLELTDKELNDSTSVVEYNIKISNTGNVAGYAKSIMNYLPNGMTFNSQINPDWYQTQDGVLHCISMAEELIQPGESKDIKLVLSKKTDKNMLGLTRGRAEIGITYNENGIEEINASSARYLIEDSNISASNIITIKKSNVKKLSVITISIIFIGLIGLMGFTMYEVKKQLIDKMYDIEKLDK